MAERVRLQLETKRIAELQAEQHRRERDRDEHDLPPEERAEKEREDVFRVAARQRHECNAQQPWSDAWATFQRTCNQLDDLERRPATIAEIDIDIVDFWPTRVGSYESCTVDAVREFFANPIIALDRKTMLRLARLWHPDRSMRLFSQSKNEEEIRGKVTMVTAVINGILETY